MGNRAVITTNENLNDIGIYLHWNGGRDSVDGFLKYCKMKGYRPPEEDSYGWAYLCTTIGNYFGDGLSLGINVANKLDCDNWDNGVYIIKKWEIVGRKYYEYAEQRTYGILDMLIDIDNAQPKPVGYHRIEEFLKEEKDNEF